MTAPTIQPWPRIASRHGEDLHVFRPRWDMVQNPRTRAQMERVVCETPDWVNVVAFTPERELVMIRQYRFGTERVELEIPGGLIDPGETPESSAVRELEEETGYAAARWTSLGSVAPNPAYQDNRCWHFLAEGAVPAGDQDLDPGEDIAVEVMSTEQVMEAIRSGAISHALCITALSHVLDLRSQ
ncbi:MAG: NUDIX hydrolase [Planctomycetota bacterium]|nr:NUDIX hydrolase [Planctomycetota bacterium]